MSTEDTWFDIGLRNVPLWQRLILDGIGFPQPIRTEGGEIVRYFAKLQTDAKMNPIALIVKVECADLEIYGTVRLVFANKPIKVVVRFEEL